MLDEHGLLCVLGKAGRLIRIVEHKHVGGSDGLVKGVVHAAQGALMCLIKDAAQLFPELADGGVKSGLALVAQPMAKQECTSWSSHMQC